MLLLPRETKERLLILCPVVSRSVKPGVCALIQVNSVPLLYGAQQAVFLGILIFVGLNLQCQRDFRTT